MVYTELSDFVGAPLTEKEALTLMGRLSEPFDPKYIDWKPQVKSRDGKKAMAAAYADVRAYIDRLNQVVGRQNWAHSLDVKMMDYHAFGRNQEGSVKSKVMVVVGLAIKGLGVGVDVGESPADDPNAFTSAFAQAFKRACVQFGLGRYLYEIENRWYELDEYGQWVKGKEPKLPDWAIPKSATVRKSPKTAALPKTEPAASRNESEPVSEADPAPAPEQAVPVPVVDLPETAASPAPVRAPKVVCAECGVEIVDAEINGKVFPVSRIVASGMQKYGKPVCLSCGIKLKQPQTA